MSAIEYDCSKQKDSPINIGIFLSWITLRIVDAADKTIADT